MSKCANWQTLDCLRVGNFDSVDVRVCVYVRARACMTIAVGITAQQELMRRVTDGAACLCQQTMEDSLVAGAKRLREPRWGERASREPVLMGNVKRCSGGRVWLTPRLHCTTAVTPASHTAPHPPPTPWITKSTLRHLHLFFFNKQKDPEKLQINQRWTK